MFVGVLQLVLLLVRLVIIGIVILAGAGILGLTGTGIAGLVLLLVVMCVASKPR